MWVWTANFNAILYKYVQLVMAISFTTVSSWKLRLSTSSLATVHKTVTLHVQSQLLFGWPGKNLFYFRVFFSSAAASILHLATIPNFPWRTKVLFPWNHCHNGLFEQGRGTAAELLYILRSNSNSHCSLSIILKSYGGRENLSILSNTIITEPTTSI